MRNCAAGIAATSGFDSGNDSSITNSAPVKTQSVREWRPITARNRPCESIAPRRRSQRAAFRKRFDLRLPDRPRPVTKGTCMAWPAASRAWYGGGVISANTPEETVAKRSARRVLLAKPRGYCAGVDRAVQAVEVALEMHGAPVYVRKQIVHNTHVVAGLEKRGAIFVEETDEVPEGAVIVFSAHGVAPQVRADAEKRNLRTIDATCPLVTKVHNEARRFAAQGYDILLIGHEGHEEVVGTTGEAPAHIRLVDGPGASVETEVRDPAKVAWLSQTTLSVDETQETVAALRKRFPLLVDPPSDDICYATQNRQAAVKQIAGESDVVLVVGSRNSSNSVRLVEVARDAGAGASYLVEDAGAVQAEWLAGASTVGLTSGASVPEDLVEGVLARLAESGFTEVEDVEAIPERMQFALPHVLRRERSARR